MSPNAGGSSNDDLDELHLGVDFGQVIERNLTVNLHAFQVYMDCTDHGCVLKRKTASKFKVSHINYN